MRYFSLFSGIGGFELAIKRAYARRRDMQKPRREGLQHGGNIPVPDDHAPPACVGYSEIDPHALAIYRRHFPRHRAYGDITRVHDLPPFDLLVGGFPCQAFSISGRGGGFADPRGNLFFEVVRVLASARPRLCVLENVKGLLTHNGGDTFSRVLTALDDVGYDLQWQVLNSAHFAVPQNRERVYFVGHRRGTARPEVFPLNQASGQIATERVPLPLPYRVRYLTPLECERLQGLPDHWTRIGLDESGRDIRIADTHRYRCLGNAVTVNVVEAILARMVL